MTFDRYPPQRFLGELRRFLRENKPPNFSIDLKWELVNDEEEERLLEGLHTLSKEQTVQETYLSQLFLCVNIHMDIERLHNIQDSVVLVVVRAVSVHLV